MAPISFRTIVLIITLHVEIQENDLLEDRQTMFSSIDIHSVTKFSLNRN